MNLVLRKKEIEKKELIRRRINLKLKIGGK